MTESKPMSINTKDFQISIEETEAFMEKGLDVLV